ncbi:MAG: acyl-CoA thioesterase [Bacteroidales bacterium]
MATRQCRMVLPCNLNDHDTLFGGTALQWMDEVAYIEATRFTRKKMVTTSVEEVKFEHSIKKGDIVEIIAKVVNTGNVKIKIQVEMIVEGMYTGTKSRAVKAFYYFVSLDANDNPVRLMKG